MQSTERYKKMKVALMVAEKPSLAASLAEILSDGKNTSRKSNNGSCSIHEWRGTLFNEPVQFKMTSVCGHVMVIDFPQKFNNWNKVEPTELFSCPTEKKESVPKLRIPTLLAQEARGCDYLILWLDCDKEGENICFEVIEAVKKSMNRPIYVEDVVWRARFSSITHKDIKTAMANLVKPNKNEALSVDARQEIDLRIGCAFTRFQTKFFHMKYGDLDSTLISFGPCQTPTLGFCVDRHDQIQTFKPEPYWVIEVSTVTKDKKEYHLTHESSRMFDRDAARTVFNRVKKFTTLQVMAITSNEKKRTRPMALNTVELMRAASSGLNFGPQHTMAVAERLYTMGYISYPRTETTKHPDNFDLMEVLTIFQRSADYGEYASQVIVDGCVRPVKGRDVGDHPPITPMRLASPVELSGDQWKIYDYIVRHFIASLSRDCKYISTTTTFKRDGETFTLVGDVVVDAGFTLVMPWLANNKNRLTSAFVVGEEVPITVPKLTEYKTTPPDFITESELITLMEKHGIGTDASIPAHINNITQRNYVNVVSGRKLMPTNLGIVLVHGYQRIDKELVEPTTRSRLEGQLNLIATGRADYRTVLRQALEVYRRKFEFFIDNIAEMDCLFEVSFTPLANTGRALSRCGKCRRYMKYIQAKPNRLHCSHCNETYSLPQNGNIRIFKEFRCPLDDFELLSWSTGAKGVSYPLCPNCYNNPPYEHMKKASGCIKCIDMNCRFSVYSVGIGSCENCRDGIVCLDLSSGPKWKLICNKCEEIQIGFDGAKSVSVEKTACSRCNGQLIRVSYKEENTKLPGDRVEMVDCMFCNKSFAALVRKQQPVSSKPAMSNHHQHMRKNKNRRYKKPAKKGDKMAELAAYFV